MARNTSNTIKHLLKFDETRTASLQEVHELVVNHFSGILDSVRGIHFPQLTEIFHAFISKKCSSAQLTSLLVPVTTESIKIVF